MSRDPSGYHGVSPFSVRDGVVAIAIGTLGQAALMAALSLGTARLGLDGASRAALAWAGSQILVVTWVAGRALLQHATRPREILLEAAGLVACAPRHVLAALLLAGPTQLVAAVAWNQGGPAAESWPALTITFVSMVAFAPLSEELIFRGIALPAFVTRFGASRGVAITSLAFAAAHPAGLEAGASVVTTQLLAGILTAILRLRTGSLLPPIALHSCHNAIVFLA